MGEVLPRDHTVRPAWLGRPSRGLPPRWHRVFPTASFPKERVGVTAGAAVCWRSRRVSSGLAGSELGNLRWRMPGRGTA